MDRPMSVLPSAFGSIEGLVASSGPWLKRQSVSRPVGVRVESDGVGGAGHGQCEHSGDRGRGHPARKDRTAIVRSDALLAERGYGPIRQVGYHDIALADTRDRKSTRLNSSHLGISYAVFCL